MKLAKKILLGCLFALTFWSMAFAEPLTLRAKVNASSDVVLFGDFFEGVGEAASTPFFRSPRPGRKGAVRVSRLVRAVEQMGYTWVPPEGLRRIRVTRNVATIEVAEIDKLIRAELSASLPDAEEPQDLDLILPNNLRTVRVNDSSTRAMVISQLDLNPRTQSFTAHMVFGDGDAQVRRSIEGRYRIKRRVPVLNKSMRRSDIIEFEDIDWLRLDETRLGNVVMKADEIIGKAARRAIADGVPMRAADLESPRIILRNQLVTIIYRVPGMTLTARGRALRDAAAGDGVSVLNLASKQTIDAIATGPGQVSITSADAAFEVASN